MTCSEEELTARVQAVTRGAARRYIGLAVGAFAGAGTAVHGVGRVREGGDAPTADTLFQVGSVTKVFTALALADAVVRGEVSLDTPLASYLPEAPTSRGGRQITLAHLASHTSGLPRLPHGLRRQARRHPADPYREFSTDDLRAALAAAELRREPGARVRYSNFGAGLLGEALSRHTGLPYERLIEERVARTLRLADTVITPRADQEHRLAVGHSPRRRPVPDWDLGAMPGAGALRSTVHDLLALLRASLDPSHAPLSGALDLVQRPRARADRWVQVGLGWHLSPVRGTEHTALWHNGGTGGSASYVALIPSVAVGVVVLTNTARPVDRLGHDLLSQLAAPAGAPAVP